MVIGDSRRYGLEPAHLTDDRAWSCLMNRRSDWLRTRRWLRLDGRHRALGDTLGAREILLEMASPGGSVHVAAGPHHEDAGWISPDPSSAHAGRGRGALRLLRPDDTHDVRIG